MKLSLVVSTYNRWKLCEAALNSIFQQRNEHLEVILVDDASPDLMPTSVSSLIEWGCVRFYRHSENSGLSSVRNTALKIASANYFSFCDDDDQWPPGLASKLVEAMESAPDDVGMAIVLSEDRKPSCGHLFDGYPRLTELMMRGLTPPVGSQIYRTDLLRQVGGYRSEITSGVDHDLWISLARVDPRVAVVWAKPAIVGSSPSRERMTTVEQRRRAGIEKSLRIWRDDLCDVFGDAFYHHFLKSYRQYLDYSFFVKSIQKGEYFDSLKRSFLNPSIPYELIKRRWNKLRGRQRCTLFPEFKGE